MTNTSTIHACSCRFASSTWTFTLGFLLIVFTMQWQQVFGWNQGSCYQSDRLLCLRATDLTARCIGWGQYSTLIPQSFYEATVDVENIFSADVAIVVKKYDGTVFAVGDPTGGGQIPLDVQVDLLIGVKKVASSDKAFAVIKADDTVTAWGPASSGGDCSAVQDQLTSVKQLFSSTAGFVALKYDGTIVTWGSESVMNIPASVSLTNVKFVASNDRCFVALMGDGSVYSWGNNGETGVDDDVVIPASKAAKLTDVVMVYSNYRAHAALKADGTVITWGCCTTIVPSCTANCWYDRDYGANPTSATIAQLTDVTSIVSTNNAFCAMKKDGTVVAWGGQEWGGEIDAITQDKLINVKSVFATTAAFLALLENGDVHTWGQAGLGGVIPNSILDETDNRILDNVVTVTASQLAGFAVLRRDGSVRAWPYLDYNSFTFIEWPNSRLNNIIALYASGKAWAAINSTGYVHTIGQADYGGEVPSHDAEYFRTHKIDIVFGSTKSFADSTARWQYPCPAGKYGEGWPDCDICPTPEDASQAKWWADGIRTRIGSCLNCPHGSFSEDGIKCADTCAAGFSYNSPRYWDSSQAGCQKCASGYYYNEQYKECRQCEAGTFSEKNSHGYFACTPCPTGKFSGDKGTTSCNTCGEGFTTKPVASDDPKGKTVIDDCLSKCSPGQYGERALSGGKKNCIDCPIGKVSSKDSFECTACSPGEYSFSNRSESCIPCPFGTFSYANGSSSCGDCNPDTYADALGSSFCKTCPEGEGTGGVRGSSVCKNKGLYQPFCDAGRGKVASGPRQGYCDVCEKGKYAQHKNTGGCKPCPKGRFAPDVGSAECIECPVGTHGMHEGAISNKTCDKCEISTYNSRPGSDSCAQCPPGSLCPHSGMSNFYLCPAGSSARRKGSVDCTPCGKGFFQPEQGEAFCFPCPAGKYTSRNGSATESECVDCAAGKASAFVGTAECVVCPRTQFAAEAGSTSCEECVGDGQIANPKRTGCMEDPSWSMLSGPSLIETMYTKGGALVGAFSITALFVAIAATIQYKKSVSRKAYDEGSAGSSEGVVNGGTNIAILGIPEVLLKSALPGFNFGSEVFLVAGMLADASPGLGITMIIFRVFHVIVAAVFVSAIFRHNEAVWLESNRIVSKATDLHDLIEDKFARLNVPFVGGVALMSLCDCTMLQFLPWKESLIYTESKGFPTVSMMRWCLSAKVVQTVVSVVCQIAYLTNGKDVIATTSQAKVLFALNITLAVVGATMGLMLLCLKEGMMHHLERKEKRDKNDKHQDRKTIHHCTTVGSNNDSGDAATANVNANANATSSAPRRASNNVSFDSTYTSDSNLELATYTSNPMLNISNLGTDPVPLPLSSLSAAGADDQRDTPTATHDSTAEFRI